LIRKKKKAKLSRESQLCK